MSIVFSLFAAPATVLVLLLLLTRRALLLDQPNERSLHSTPTPRIGGLAMLLALGLILPWGLFDAPSPLVGLLLLAAGLGILSLLDDWRGLPVRLRLLAHLAAAGVAIWLLGLPLLLALPAILAIGWMTNLYNFMDGADGLAGSMALFGFGAYALAASLAGPEVTINANSNAVPTELTFASLAIASAAAGFLLFNFPPARVFLGDAGSIPLGFLAGVLGIYGWQAGLWSWLFPLLVFAPFILDASLTLLKRLLRGERFWQAHRQHLYQRLICAGWSHRRLLAAAWPAMALCTSLAMLMAR